jgi:hypothetical protein
LQKILTEIEIEHASLKSNDIELNITKPVSHESNSNQYLINFSDHSEKNVKKTCKYSWSPTICIIGDWEYYSFLSCLSDAAKYIEKNVFQGQKTFRDQSDCLKLMIFKKKDSGQLRFKFTFDQQKPIFKREYSSDESGRSFSFTVDESNLKDFAKVIMQLENDNVFSPVLVSSTEDWAVNQMITWAQEEHLIAYKKITSDVVDHITCVAPESLRPHWIRLINEIFNFPRNVAKCKSCGGKFSREAKWKKECLGCYRKKTPTAVSQEIVDAVCVEDWLKSV